jgi:hypothetical protein
MHTFSILCVYIRRASLPASNNSFVFLRGIYAFVKQINIVWIDLLKSASRLKLSLSLTKHHSMKAFGGVEV